MSSERHERISDLFQRAVDLSPSERTAFLERECGGDLELREAVESLIGYDDVDSGSDLFAEERLAAGRRRLAEVADAPSTAALELPLAPARVGPFDIVRLLGRGGMGEVYLARQTAPLEREVALKLLHATTLTAQALRRFELERECLSAMNHPGIARILDAGETQDGRPYLAMEYVAGDPITTYCDKARLAVEARLRLFLDACAAVEHAHQRGVLHRDLKPTNLLVTEVDGRPVPKVIDFGLARAFGDAGPERSLLTLDGQLLGTPAYMSPEQADASHTDIDSRTDVYSLGVLLFELLTGELPFDLEGLESPRALAKRLQEWTRGDTPRPSSRVSGDDESIRHAAKRSSEPRVLARRLRTDLDWIVMKALEGERSRRYGSVAALADDVRRSLQHEPIEAGPPSTYMLARKFVRRHRALVVGATLVLITLLGGLLTTLREARRAQRSEIELRNSLEEMQASNQILNHMLIAPDPRYGGRDATFASVLGRGVDYTLENFSDRPLAAANALQSIGATYRELGMWQEAERVLDHAIEFRRKADDGNHAALAYSLNSLGLTLRKLGRHDEAIQVYREAIATFDRILEPESPVQKAVWQQNLARVLILEGEIDEAAGLLEEALASHEELVGDQDIPMAHSLMGVARVRVQQGELDEAEELARGAIARLESAEAPDVFFAAFTLELASIYIERGTEADRAEALSLARDSLERVRAVYDESSPPFLRYLAFYAKAASGAGDFEAAGEAAARGLVIARERLAADPREMLPLQILLGRALLEQGQAEEAEAVLDEAFALADQAPADLKDRYAPKAAAGLARVWMSESRVDEARDLARSFPRGTDPELDELRGDAAE